MEDFVEIDSMISGSHKTFFRRLLTYVNPPVVAAAAPTAGDAIVALQSAMGVVHAPRRPKQIVDVQQGLKAITFEHLPQSTWPKSGFAIGSRRRSESWFWLEW